MVGPAQTHRARGLGGPKQAQLFLFAHTGPRPARIITWKGSRYERAQNCGSGRMPPPEHDQNAATRYMWQPQHCVKISSMLLFLFAHTGPRPARIITWKGSRYERARNCGSGRVPPPEHDQNAATRYMWQPQHCVKISSMKVVSSAFVHPCQPNKSPTHRLKHSPHHKEAPTRSSCRNHAY